MLAGGAIFIRERVAVNVNNPRLRLAPECTGMHLQSLLFKAART
jgi:hypothetical protein